MNFLIIKVKNENHNKLWQKCCLQEAYPILLGDIDMSGNLQAHILDAPSQNTRLVHFIALPNFLRPLDWTADKVPNSLHADN